MNWRMIARHNIQLATMPTQRVLDIVFQMPGAEARWPLRDPTQWLSSDAASVPMLAMPHP